MGTQYITDAIDSGAAFPWVFPVSFSGRLTNFFSINYEGTVPTSSLKIYLQSPTEDFFIENFTTQQRIQLSGTITANEYVVLDMGGDPSDQYSRFSIIDRLSGESRISMLAGNFQKIRLVPGENDIFISSSLTETDDSLVVFFVWYEEYGAA